MSKKKRPKSLEDREEIKSCMMEALEHMDDSTISKSVLKRVGSESAEEKHWKEMWELDQEDQKEGLKRDSKHRGLGILKGLKNPRQAKKIIEAVSFYMATHPDADEASLHSDVIAALARGLGERGKRNRGKKKKVPSQDAHVEGEKKGGRGRQQ